MKDKPLREKGKKYPGDPVLLYPDGPQASLVRAARAGENHALQMRNVFGRIADWADRDALRPVTRQHITEHLAVLQSEMEMVQTALRAMEEHFGTAQMGGEKAWF